MWRKYAPPQNHGAWCDLKGGSSRPLAMVCPRPFPNYSGLRPADVYRVFLVTVSRTFYLARSEFSIPVFSMIRLIQHQMPMIVV
jgi:hypothetical protein